MPRLSVSVRDLVDATTRRKLQSGLPQTIVVRAAVYPDGSDEPIAATVRSCRVTYDLWEEIYRLHVLSPGTDRSTSAGSIDDVVRLCLELRAVEVGARAQYRGGRRIYVAFLAELNPVSRDMLARVRRWLSRPSGTLGESDGFFGSFISLFVNRRIGSAERSVRFRSQTEVVP